MEGAHVWPRCCLLSFSISSFLRSVLHVLSALRGKDFLFHIHLCLKQRHLLLVSESIKNVMDQCHYPELHLEDKSCMCSCWIDALGSMEGELHFGQSQTCQSTLWLLPSKDHSQGKSYKSINDCDKASKTQNCLSCPVKWWEQKVWL